MEIEKYPWRKIHNSRPVIGVDEVGRGCLAGPVYAAACILNEDEAFGHYTDSKKINPKKREILSQEIKNSHQVVIGQASVEEIDQLNILKAALLAMLRAVEGLKVQKGIVLVDGTFKIPNLSENFEQFTLVKGDFRAEPIAAASIVAKVERDNWISLLDDKFPAYQFSKHKGYSTKVHKQAIADYGPCIHHRKTFAGVKEYIKSKV